MIGLGKSVQGKYMIELTRQDKHLKINVTSDQRKRINIHFSSFDFELFSYFQDDYWFKAEAITVPLDNLQKLKILGNYLTLTLQDENFSFEIPMTIKNSYIDYRTEFSKLFD